MSEAEEVIEESVTQGLADWFESNVDPDTDIEQAAHQLQLYASENKLLVPDARGLSVFEAFMKLVDWLRNRQFVRDLGIQQASFHLLEFHVPPEGKGSISWKKSIDQSEGMTVKVFGSGLGGTASIKLSRTLDLKDCTACQDIVQHLEIHVREYATKSATGADIFERTADPVRWLHREPRERKQCCAQPLSTLDKFKFETLDESAIDARNTKARMVDQREFEYKFGVNLSLKLDLLGNIEVGAECKAEGSLQCAIEWEFAPGALYMPYVFRKNRGVLPRWSIA